MKRTRISTGRREVLEAFWRSGEIESPRTLDAARAYGPKAVALIFVVALEFSFVGWVALLHRDEVGWLALVVAALVIASDIWAMNRCRRLSARTSRSSG